MVYPRKLLVICLQQILCSDLRSFPFICCFENKEVLNRRRARIDRELQTANGTSHGTLCRPITKHGAQAARGSGLAEIVDKVEAQRDDLLAEALTAATASAITTESALSASAIHSSLIPLLFPSPHSPYSFSNRGASIGTATLPPAWSRSTEAWCQAQPQEPAGGPPQ